MLRKLLSVWLCMVLFATPTGLALAATSATVQDRLQLIEQDTYGTEQTGALMDRINQLEKDYNGTHRDGSMTARVDALYAELYENDGRPSLMADMNAVEWNIGHARPMVHIDQF